MTHAPNEAQLDTQLGHHATARPRMASRLMDSPRYVDSPAETPQPGRPFLMRWSIGPNGGLWGQWDRADRLESSELVGCGPAGLPGRRRRQAPAPGTRILEHVPPSVGIASTLMEDAQRIEATFS